MGAISLYRKHRPRTFADVIGQDHITTTIAHALERDTLHHAYLFTGPRGTGKTSTARIVATAVNCADGPTAQPCGTCTHCTQITAGAHVDVIEIDAASHGGVDDVRDLRDRVAYAPAQARRKVYIVDECHMLSTAGWNAFLKTVEEPPGHVLFVFATTEPHKVLPTILSRTQRFDFRRVTAATLTSHVEEIARQEGLSLTAGAVELLVRAGDGSVRDTLSVLEQVVAFTGRDVTAEAVADVLGHIPGVLLDDLAGHLADGDIGALCGLVGRVADQGYDLRQFARDAVEHLRVLFLLSTAPAADLVDATPERLAELTEQAGRLGDTELLRAVDLLADAQLQMRRGQVRLPLELALAKSALPEVSGDVAALAARLDRIERAGLRAAPGSAAPGSAPQPSGSAAPSAAGIQEEPPGGAADLASGGAADLASGGAADLASVQSSWPSVLEALRQVTRRWHAFASMSEPVAFDGRVLTLGFRPGYGLHAEQCASPEGQKTIVAALERVLGLTVTLRCVVRDSAQNTGGAAAPASSDAAEIASAPPREAAAVAEAEHEPPTGDAAHAHASAVARLESELGAHVIDEQA